MHPEAQAASRQDVRHVLDALARVPEEHRVVLSLFAVDGLNQAQIADIVGYRRRPFGLACIMHANASGR